MRKNNKSLKIKAFTWSKDSHGLFDYETPHLTIHRGFCKENLHLYRFDKDVVFLDPKSKNPTPDFTSLCNINVTEDGRFTVSSKDDSSPVMLVIRSMKSGGKQKGYELKAGDRVKTGRVEYYIREVRNEDGVVQKATDPLLCLNYNKGMDIEEREDEKHICRICYSEESAEEKGVPEIKFLTPCKCKGTSQYLHFSCLRDWLESKRQLPKTNLPSLQNQPTMNENILAQIQNYFVSTMGPNANGITNILNEINPFNSNSTTLGQDEAETQQSSVKTHFFSNFCCDVCKEVLPFSIITSKGNEYETVDIPRPEKEPYILFERVSQGKDPKTFSIIKGISDQDIKIGRGFSSEIVVSDISVSRFHAYIKFQNGRFYLFDKNSKFGTLVQLRDPLEVHKEKIGIQSGRTLITFSVREEKVREEADEMIESLSRIAETCKTTPQSNKKTASQKKNGSSVKKSAKKKDNRDGGSEGTLDVDEMVPLVNKELNSRSKKINKRSSRPVEKRQ